MLEANDMVEAKLAEIRERKLHEMKRMFAAKMHEGVGGLTKAEVEARKKAGYKKASDVLGDPRKEMTPIAGHQFKKVKKKISEETLDEAGLGDAARAAHALQKDPKKAAQFRLAMKLKRVTLGKKQEPESEDKSKYPDTPGGRNRKRADERLAKREGPESGKSAWERSVGGKIHGAIKRSADAPVWKDLQDIGFRNI